MRLDSSCSVKNVEKSPVASPVKQNSEDQNIDFGQHYFSTEDSSSKYLSSRKISFESSDGEKGEYYEQTYLINFTCLSSLSNGFSK